MHSDDTQTVLSITAALHKNSHHESTKGRKHEKEFHSMRISFVISSFRAFVIGLEGGAGPVFVQSPSPLASPRGTR
jgi:hypothetical protein